MARRRFSQKTTKRIWFFFGFFTQIRSFVFLGESTVHKSVNGFIWPSKYFLSIHFPNGVLNFGSMCNQGKPCRKRLYFFLSPYIFFTCRNHCNICTGYEFFCHKKDINTLGGWKITEKVGKLRLSSQAGATFTDTCFQHMVKKNIHRSFLISSITHHLNKKQYVSKMWGQLWFMGS